MKGVRDMNIAVASADDIAGTTMCEDLFPPYSGNDAPILNKPAIASPPWGRSLRCIARATSDALPARRHPGKVVAEVATHPPVHVCLLLSLL